MNTVQILQCFSHLATCFLGSMYICCMVIHKQEEETCYKMEEILMNSKVFTVGTHDSNQKESTEILYNLSGF